MCGVLGILAAGNLPDDHIIERMRDTMSRRGPDGAGLWRSDHIILAHRRLAVIDTSEAAAQPMVRGAAAISYNGELYNDAEVRQSLAHEGVNFTTTSDTETVLQALIHWGPAALSRLRGMYALAYYNGHTLLLARDPLGIKPLYYTLSHGGRDLLFASDAAALLSHPGVKARPDFITLSAYLSTIRTVLGSRTMFEGIQSLRPGQIMECTRHDDGISVKQIPVEFGRATSGDITSAIEESVRLHLRSDVPVCCMLSGGLDSSIIASITAQKTSSLYTFCSGAEGGDDFRFARMMADRVGATHTDTIVSQQMFDASWPAMVHDMGGPLSTPNEVAINAVAKKMRAAGKVVTLSGEGADELFGGYDGVMLDAARFERLLPRDAQRDNRWLSATDAGDFHLLANAWVPPSLKSSLLTDSVWRRAEQDHALVAFYREEFDGLRRQGPDDHPLQPHLRFLRRINLAGLLQRLDTATMLESIEGRTPFADIRVAQLADSLPMSSKFLVDPVATKVCLRLGFADRLPAEIVQRPKASFPLPFQEWVRSHARALTNSPLAREFFSDAAIHTVAADPSRAWAMAWPMINIVYWAERWWGRPLA